MVVQPSLPGRAKWASDLIERLEDSQRGIVRGIKTTGDMVLQKKPVDLWLDKVVPGLALGVGLLLLVALTMPLPRSRRPGCLYPPFLLRPPVLSPSQGRRRYVTPRRAATPLWRPP